VLVRGALSVVVATGNTGARLLAARPQLANHSGGAFVVVGAARGGLHLTPSRTRTGHAGDDRAGLVGCTVCVGSAAGNTGVVRAVTARSCRFTDAALATVRVRRARSGDGRGQAGFARRSLYLVRNHRRGGTGNKPLEGTSDGVIIGAVAHREAAPVENAVARGALAQEPTGRTGSGRRGLIVRATRPQHQCNENEHQPHPQRDSHRGTPLVRHPNRL